MNESWRPIAGYIGIYEVSDLGRVRSVDRIYNHPANGPSRYRGVVLKQRTNHDGYATVDLTLAGHKKSFRVHRLVAAAFLGSLNDGQVVDHVSGDLTDNSAQNLRVCTQRQNMLNQGVRSTNRSGRTGVSFDARSAKWRASISCGGRWTSLGFFGTKDEAIAARAAAEQSTYGEFARSSVRLAID